MLPRLGPAAVVVVVVVAGSPIERIVTAARRAGLRRDLFLEH
jgi:hypothetical protein